MSDVGFTGTQEGMTEEQRFVLESALCEGRWTRFHHGDCIGADAEAHAIAKRVGMAVGIHPPKDPKKRAYCALPDNLYPEKPYRERNEDIVDYAAVLVACPKGYREERRSGTWMTVRYARKRERHVVIIWPDGSVTEERRPMVAASAESGDTR